MTFRIIDADREAALRNPVMFPHAVDSTMLAAFRSCPQKMFRTYMPHWKPLRRSLQWLHGLLGHEPSKTEWGYGGGSSADTWCRWCDKMMRIPIEEARFRYKLFNAIRPDKSVKGGDKVSPPSSSKHRERIAHEAIARAGATLAALGKEGE